MANRVGVIDEREIVLCEDKAEADAQAGQDNDGLLASLN